MFGVVPITMTESKRGTGSAEGKVRKRVGPVEGAARVCQSERDWALARAAGPHPV